MASCQDTDAHDHHGVRPRSILDDRVVIALRQMIDLICARTGLDSYQAYTSASLAADLRITQVVNGAKGVHVMLGKAIPLARSDSRARLA